jgi:predicted SnoaL-like aldol condensation-catalyzing enzyme
MSEQNKALVHRFLEEVDKGEIAVLDRNVDPKYGDHNPPRFPGLAPSLAGAQQAFTMALGASQDFHHVVEDQVAEGEKVVSRITAWGTHTGELRGIPPTHKNVSMAGIAMHRIVRGKLVEHWATIDAFGSLQQLGVAPGAPIGGSPGVFAAKAVAAAVGTGGRSTPDANKALLRRFVESHLCKLLG